MQICTYLVQTFFSGNRNREGDFFEGGCLLNRGTDLQVGANSRIYGARYMYLAV